MKTCSKFLLFVPFLLLLSCTKDLDPQHLEPDDTVLSKTSEYFAKSNDAEFLKSVAIIQGGLELDPITANYSLFMTVKDFSGNYQLHDAFIIDGIEYCDNGQFNDEVANDGIYTSVDQYAIDASDVPRLRDNYFIHTGSDFAHESELQSFLNAAGPGFGIYFGCKLRLVTCPETSWYNDCWFGSPCTCIEFYDCYVEVGVSLTKA